LSWLVSDDCHSWLPPPPSDLFSTSSSCSAEGVLPFSGESLAHTAANLCGPGFVSQIASSPPGPLGRAIESPFPGRSPRCWSSARDRTALPGLRGRGRQLPRLPALLALAMMVAWALRLRESDSGPRGRGRAPSGRPPPPSTVLGSAFCAPEDWVEWEVQRRRCGSPRTRRSSCGSSGTRFGCALLSRKASLGGRFQRSGGDSFFTHVATGRDVKQCQV
jgi:hypothetical protein